MSFIDTLKQRYKYGNIAVKLIFWNIGIYLFTQLLKAFFTEEFYYVFNYLRLDSEYLERAWTFITYAFLHDLKDITHIIFNMIMLYVVGDLFFRFFRKENFITFYVFGAIAGGIAYALYAAFANHSVSYLVGASAAVYAILWAVVAYSPKIQLQLAFLNVKFPLDYLAYALLGIDIIMLLSGNNIGGRIAHLGGIAFGFLYMKQFEKGNDFLGKITQFFMQPKFEFNAPKPKLKKHKTKQQSTPRNDYDYQESKHSNQQEIDKILDKISASGYESLSKKEKDTLFKYGK